jgi:hypothetical protein
MQHRTIYLSPQCGDTTSCIRHLYIMLDKMFYYDKLSVFFLLFCCCCCEKGKDLAFAIMQHLPLILTCVVKFIYKSSNPFSVLSVHLFKTLKGYLVCIICNCNYFIQDDLNIAECLHTNGRCAPSILDKFEYFFSSF